MHRQIRQLQEHHARRVQDKAAEILDARPPIVTAVVGTPKGLASKEIVCAMDLRNWSPAEGWATLEWVAARMHEAYGIVANEEAPEIDRLGQYAGRAGWLPQNGEVLIPGIDPTADEVGEFIGVHIPEWW